MRENNLVNITHYKKGKGKAVFIGCVSEGAFISLGGMLESEAKAKKLILYKKPRKRPDNEESRLQQGCVTWYRLQYANLKKALFAVPNGGKRDEREAVTLRREGVTAGVSDLILAIPNKHNNGVFIEMKTPKGTLRQDQKEFLGLMSSLGYRVEVVRTFERFVEVVTEQMRGR